MHGQISQLVRFPNDTVFDTEYFRHIQWSDCNCTLTFDLYLTHDGGHSWPGGPGGIVGDPSSQYISANTLMWEFFEQFSLDCNDILAVNEANEDKKKIKVYPNPSEGSFIIVGKKINKVTIYDLQGKIYINMDFHPSDMINFDLSGKESGYYFIRVAFGDNEEEMVRFLLE